MEEKEFLVSSDLTQEVISLRESLRFLDDPQVKERRVLDSFLWREREAIIQAELSEEKVKGLVQLDEALRQSPEQLSDLQEELFQAQTKELKAKGLAPEVISEQIEHLQRVAGLIDDQSVGGPVASLIAAVHDIGKYGFGGQEFMAEHEILGAIVGPRLLSTCLKRAGLGNYARALTKLAAKAILCHGEGEWPELESASSPIGDSDQVFSLLGGVFIKPPRSGEIPVESDFCRRVIQGLSEADKIGGIDLHSFLKYDRVNSSDFFYGTGSSDLYVRSLSRTFILNWKYAPEVFGIKTNLLTVEERKKGGLLFTLLKEIENWDGIDSRLKESYIEKLGPLGGHLFDLAVEMKQVFKVGEKEFQRSQLFRDNYRSLFAELVRQIDSLDSLPEQGRLAEKIDRTLSSLKEYWSENENDYERLKNLCREEVLSLFPGCLGFRELGRRYGQGGKDVDLWAVFENDSLSSPAQEERIKRLLASSGLEVHLFFMSQKDLQEGRIEYPEASLVYLFLKDGLDHHQYQVALEDFSFLALYAFATTGPFVARPGQAEKLEKDCQQGLAALHLTPSAIESCTHYYAACFLNHYFGGRDDSYRQGLAKFLIRAALGYALIDEDQAGLAGLKDSLVAIFQGDSPDELMAEFSLQRASGFFNDQDRELLRTAVAIRSGQEKRATIGFEREAEKLAFYLAFQQGMASRQKEWGPFDPLASLVFETMIKDLIERDLAEEILFADGEEIIKKGKTGSEADYFYFFPFKRKDEQGHWNDNGSCRVMVPGSEEGIPITPGRLFGHWAPLTGAPRSATVKAEGQLQAYRIKGRFLEDLFKNPKLQAELKSGALKTMDSRRLYVILRLLAYESAFSLRDLASYRDLPSGFEENHQTLTEANPLSPFYLDDGFLEAVIALNQAKFSLDNQPLVEAVLKAGDLEDGPLFEKGQEAGDRFFVADGPVILTGITLSGESLKIFKGAVFGEASLLGAKIRSGQAVLKAGTRAYALNSEIFKRFLHSGEKIPGTDLCWFQLLGHLAALNFGRMKNRLAKRD